MLKHKVLLGTYGCAILLSSSAVTAVVTDDLLTNSNETTAWQNCDGSDLITGGAEDFDAAHLEADGCAYRETPAVADTTYTMTCGVSSLKYSSMTLAYLNDAGTTLATQTTEIYENVQGGAYSVTHAAPAGTTTAAVGIYGLAGSGFQNCTLLLDNPDTGPQDGSISGLSWFDEDGNMLLANTESLIASTPVTVSRDGAVVDQMNTGLQGEFYFGGLDLGACYQVMFAPADATLTLTGAGGDNAAVNSGSTLDVCLSADAPNVTNINAGFVSVAPVVPPADYAICGRFNITNPEANGNDVLANIPVTLTNTVTLQKRTATSNASGNFTFDSLPGGYYAASIDPIAGHTVTDGKIGLTGDISLQILLPDSGDESLACTYTIEVDVSRDEVSLDTTIANDDEARGLIGEDIFVQILENDNACNDDVTEVNILGHNIPGNVVYNPALDSVVISNTNASGAYSIDYGLRGSCGSYDTAVVSVAIAVVPAAGPDTPPAIPACFASIGKADSPQSRYHIDLVPSEAVPITDFASEFNFYDADMQLLLTGLKIEGGSWREVLYYREGYRGAEIKNIKFVTAVENGFESAPTECTTRSVTPIALDLDNSGHVESINGNFSFDITGNGLDENLTEWFSPSEGILINKNYGKAISGEFLFGDVGGKYADGFAKLALEDVNSDGLISGKELENLAIWTDSNSNAQVDQGEISSLKSHSLESLPVKHYKYSARAALKNGHTMLMRDLWFSLSPFTQASK